MLDWKIGDALCNIVAIATGAEMMDLMLMKQFLATLTGIPARKYYTILIMEIHGNLQFNC